MSTYMTLGQCRVACILFDDDDDGGVGDGDDGDDNGDGDDGGDDYGDWDGDDDDGDNDDRVLIMGQALCQLNYTYSFNFMPKTRWKVNIIFLTLQ